MAKDLLSVIFLKRNPLLDGWLWHNSLLDDSWQLYNLGGLGL